MKGKEGAEMHPGGLQTLLDVSIYVEKLFFIYYIGFVVFFFRFRHAWIFFLSEFKQTDENGDHPFFLLSCPEQTK